MLEKTAGQIDFEAYVESKQGITYDGKLIPTWENLTDEVRLGWEVGAKATINSIEIGNHLLYALDKAREKLKSEPTRGRYWAILITDLEKLSAFKQIYL